MKVFIRDSVVFEDPGCFDSLLQLFWRVLSDFHSLVVHDMPGLRNSAFFYQALPPYKRTEWSEWLERQALDGDFRDRATEPGARPQKPHIEVVVDFGPISEHCIRQVLAWEVGAWSILPLRLLLEDDDDFALLVGAARAFEAVKRGDKSWIEKAKDRNALNVDGRGGCGNVWATLKEYDDDARHHHRLVVIVDSDKDNASAPLRSPQVQILDCESSFSEARCIVLRKREVENYLPHDHLDHESRLDPKKRHSFRAWNRLSDEEKDYDDLKNRFGESWIQGVLRNMRNADTFTAANLKRRAGGELRNILRTIQERL